MFNIIIKKELVAFVARSMRLFDLECKDVFIAMAFSLMELNNSNVLSPVLVILEFVTQ